MNNILEISNLTKRYGHFTLNDVSFCVPEGTIVGFVGENGAGKTTTIKLILNLIKKDRGDVKIFKEDNILNETLVKERIGVVFESSCFHNTLTPKDIDKIMKNIYKNWSSDLYFNYLSNFALPKDTLIKSFSNGMKMKLSIIAALSHRPDLLILDEATNGLDPIVREDFLDLFRDFISDGKRSVLLSSHITSDIQKIADYVSFIHNGEIVFTESKDDLIDHYGILKCTAADFEKLGRDDMVGYRKNQFGFEALVKNKAETKTKYKDCVLDNISIEDILLFYVRGERS